MKKDKKEILDIKEIINDMNDIKDIKRDKKKKNRWFTTSRNPVSIKLPLVKILKKDILLTKVLTKNKIKNYIQCVNFPSVANKYNFVLERLHKKHKSLDFKSTLLYLKSLYLNTIQYNLLKTLKKQTTYLGISNSNNIQSQHLSFSELQFSRIFTSRVEKRKKFCYFLLKKKMKKDKKEIIKDKNIKKKKNDLRLNLMSFAHKKNNISKSKKLVKFVSSLNQKLALGRLNFNPNFFSKKVKKLRKFYTRTFQKFRKLKKRRFYLLKKKIRHRRRLKKFLGYWVKRKGKKRLKLRIPPIFRYYRNRHRLYFHFYIPRFLEINYKTFCFVHLDTVNYSTIGHKIPLILNLGKVQTKVSF